MPMAGYSGYMAPYGAYPGMMMGGFPMQYGAMGYPMQQQTVPGVVPGMQRGQQSGSQYGYSAAAEQQAAGSSSRGASEGQAGSSRAARKAQQQSKNEGGAGEAVKLPDNLNPTAGEQQASAPAPASS
jgi:hypothetical protein